MKIILKIAKAELINMFCSPIAWAVLIIFAAQAGLAYTGMFEGIFSRQVLNYPNWDISSALFSQGASSVFPMIQQYLFLYLPLITMGLMSQEVNTGSIKLLYSSPVSIREVIWGKYLAIMVYGAAVVGVLFIQVIFSAFTVEFFDLPAVLTGLLGVYLLICTYAAIGLFLSSVISSQVVVAIATFAVLAILNYIGDLGQEIPFVREITFWMSIKGRADAITKGLIGSEDLLYFIIVSGLFLALSIKYLKFEKVHTSLAKKAFSYLTILLIAVAFGALSFQPKLMSYYDATAMKSMSLKPEHQKILEKMSGGATITTYVNLFDGHPESALPQNVMYDKAFFKDYIRFKPDLKMKYVYYYNNPSITDDKELRNQARKIAIKDRTNINNFMAPDEINKMIDLSGENYKIVRLIERENGKKTWLRFFDDAMVVPGESEIMAAFMRVSVKLPRVGFLHGHGERSISRTLNRDYDFFSKANNYRYALTNQGFDVETVTLDSQKDVLAKISLLVIADVKEPIQPWELDQLKHFIAEGGNLLIAGDTGENGIMNAITEPLGIKFNTGQLVQPHKDELPDVIVGEIKPEAAKLDSSFYWMRKANLQVILNGALSLSVENNKGFTIIPLLATSPKGSWMVKDKNEINLNDLKPDQKAGQSEKENLLATCLTRNIKGVQQRIMVIVDADFQSNGELKGRRVSMPSNNYEFISNIFKWFSYGKVPIDSGRKIGRDNYFRFSSGWIIPMHLFFWVLIPVGFLFLGGLIIYRRKKR